MNHTFLSYDHEDADFADAVGRGLRTNGLTPFIDREIPPGSNWVDHIGSLLEGVPSVVVLWSGKSVDSLWVRTEAAEAAHRRILVPVLIEDVEIPPLFAGMQAVNLIGWNRSPSSKQFGRLCDSVKSFVDGRKGSLPHPAWFTELESTDLVSDLDLSLEHTTWRDPKKGANMYQIRVILVGHPTTLKRVKKVEYFLAEWEDSENHYTEKLDRNFELKQLAYGDFVVRATIEFKTRQENMVLSRFVRLEESGPYLDRYMIKAQEDA